MNLRSFLTLLSAAATASSTSAVELTARGSSFGLRNFLDQHHDEMASPAAAVRAASNSDPDEAGGEACAPTGNDPSQSCCPTDDEDPDGDIIEYYCQLPEGVVSSKNGRWERIWHAIIHAPMNALIFAYAISLSPFACSLYNSEPDARII